MPVYTYFCPSCNIDFDVTIRYDVFDSSMIVCPKCGKVSPTTGGQIIKKITLTPVIYKSDGFFSTDNKTGED